MKHLIRLALVLAMFISLTGVVSAAKPVDDTFTITGSPYFATCQQLPNGRASYHLKANGMAEGYFAGQFSFEEWGIVDYNCTTGAGSNDGKNLGSLTIRTSKGPVVVSFGGDVKGPNVTGAFISRPGNETKAGTGLAGLGRYAGSSAADGSFRVTFRGQFR